MSFVDMAERLYLVGWYGGTNVGDEIILRVLVGQCRRLLPGVELMVRSFDPARTSREQNVRAVRASVFVPPLRWWGPRTLLGLIREAWRAYRSSAVVLGGGGVLVDCDAAAVLSYLMPLYLAQLFGRRTGAIAAGR